nr:AEL_HP1_G0031010.mRNA.1.CDS.1 [Saccharomyces cerevisiae]
MLKKEKGVLTAVSSAIHLHTIAVERAIHAFKRAQRRMVMFVVKSGVDPNALPNKRDLRVDAAFVINVTVVMTTMMNFK